MSMYGIDVSSYQRGLDIKGTGARFAIMKATDGTRFVDKTCDGFVQQCKRAGILWGFYHFANSPSKSSWKAQAQYFVRHCKGYFGEGVPVLDWEDSTYGGAVRKHGPAGAKAFLDEVYRLTGVRPMVYMSASACTEWDWSAVAADYALWGAGYRSGASYSDPRTGSYKWGAFGSPVIHQYSEDGGLDRNVGYLTAEQWARFANPGKSGKASGTGRTDASKASGTGRTDASKASGTGRTDASKATDKTDEAAGVAAGGGTNMVIVEPRKDGKTLGFQALVSGAGIVTLVHAEQSQALTAIGCPTKIVTEAQWEALKQVLPVSEAKA